jgi:uncharacterized membrane protein YdbT with pleckstrin-like domain
MKNDIDKILWSSRKRNALGLPWSFTVYSYTDERFFIRTGFFKTEENEVRLYRVLDITWKQNLRQKILGLGTIILQTADKSSPIVEIKNIKNSRKVKEQLSELVETNREKKRVVNSEYMSFDDDGDSEL